MAVPINAKQFVAEMDPADILDWQATLTQGTSGSETLYPGEGVTSYTVALTAEAAAAGLLIKTAGGYATSLTGLLLEFWLEVASGSQASAAFTGAGTILGVEVTITTDNVPPRVKQRTVAIKVAQQ